MTVADLIQRLPLLGEFFPEEIVQEWSVDEYVAAQRACERRVWEALEIWKEENE